MKKSLLDNNYVVLRNFIPYDYAIELSSEFKTYCETHDVRGDEVSPTSYSKYNYITFLEILCNKVNEISHIVEEQVIPTYSYARVYLSNSVLDKHTDRDACEVSVTVHLNGDSLWPIYVKTPNNDEECIILNAGDAMIYNGTVAEHWRNHFSGTWYSQLFLHYVRSRGTCSYTYFDKVKDKEIKNNIPTSSKFGYSNKMYNRGQIMSFDERNKLNVWANELFETNKMISLTHGRYEKKLLHTDEQILPLVFDIKKKIEEREELMLCDKEEIIGDFLAVIPKNGCIHKHRDPNNWKDNLFHVRFNVFISVPDNSNTYYDGVIVNAVECSYVMCRSGIDYHWSDINHCNTPRISLSFGYLLSKEKIDTLSRIEYGTYENYYPLTVDYPIHYENLIIEERGEKGSNIFTVSNVINTYLCNKIITFFNNNLDLCETENYGYTSYSNVMCKSFLTTSNNRCKNIDSRIFEITDEVLKAFKVLNPHFLGTEDSGYRLRKITGGTRLHTDGVNSKVGKSKKNVRCLSLIIVLNDDYDGGIFHFPSQNIKFRVKPGEAVIFPPYWTHPHMVTSVGDGQARYTINTWIMEKFID
jgi:hypothetical protein